MIIEAVTAIAISAIAIIFLNPGHLAMPDTVNSLLMLSLIVAFLVFAAFIIREKSSDEREDLHVLKAGRFSYLTGVGVLIIGIIYQATKHEVDPWLVLAICAMILSKLLSRIYSRFTL